MTAQNTLLGVLVSAIGLCFIGGAVIMRYDPQAEYVGYPPLLLGLAVVVGTVSVFMLQPDSAVLAARIDEPVYDTTRPTTLPPALVAAGGYVTGSIGIWALFRTMLPIAYPVLVTGLGVYFYTRGVVGVWRNSVTWYFLTESSVVRAYELFWKVTTTVEYIKIAETEVQRTLLQRMLNYGDLVIEKDSHHQMVANNIDDPERFEAKYKRLRTELDEYHNRP